MISPSGNGTIGNGMSKTIARNGNTTKTGVATTMQQPQPPSSPSRNKKSAPAGGTGTQLLLSKPVVIRTSTKNAYRKRQWYLRYALPIALVVVFLSVFYQLNISSNVSKTLAEKSSGLSSATQQQHHSDSDHLLQQAINRQPTKKTITNDEKSKPTTTTAGQVVSAKTATRELDKEDTNQKDASKPQQDRIRKKDESTTTSLLDSKKEGAASTSAAVSSKPGVTTTAQKIDDTPRVAPPDDQTTILQRQQQQGRYPAPHLHDRTVQLSDAVDRLWLHKDNDGVGHNTKRPPAKVLLTNYVWNNVDQEKIGLRFPRSARQRELYEGVINHPWFDPYGWEEYTEQNVTIDPSVRYYVFPDFETCFEGNYPVYNGFENNADRAGNRSIIEKKRVPCYKIDNCPHLPKILDTPLFQQKDKVKATLVIFECKGDGPPPRFRTTSSKYNTSSISVASVSSAEHILNLAYDQGLPPPPVSPIILTPEQEKDIENCNSETEAKRPYLLTFSGAGRGEKARQAIVKLHNGKDIFTVKRKDFKGNQELTYEELLAGAKFSAAPRGTNLFSYRFTEVMSAGAIPVVHADGWVWPFRKELVDWSECAIIMPEDEADKTEEVLRAINDEQRCERRQKCYEIYKKYMATGEGVVAGLVEGLELIATTPAVVSETNNDKKTTVQQHPKSLLHDQTVEMSKSVDRIWLRDSLDENHKPPAKVLLTTYGWNNPDQENIGLKQSRSARQRELLEGVINHPWFDPLGWEQYTMEGAEIDPNVRYYVFMDFETCFEGNYPVYNGFENNADRTGNRSVLEKHSLPCWNINSCPYLPSILNTTLFKADNAKATLIIFDCKGDGPPTKFRRGLYGTSSISVASVSSAERKLNLAYDQGLPPPPVSPVVLTAEQEKDIENCNSETENKRKFLLTFSGAGRTERSRQAIVDLHNGKDIFTVKRSDFKGNDELTYEELLTGAKFSAAPRGTNLFSYRFTEVMSAGAIPVVHADGWVWPFRKELIDWNECAIIMPEDEANRTAEVLRAIDDEQRCKRRQRCYEIYKKYMATGEGVVAGLVEGLERLATSPTISTNNQTTVTPPPFKLNDFTILPSSGISRPWLDPNAKKPPAKILLTDYGWNNKIEALGLKQVRTIRQRELLQGIIDHPWFDPYGWEDIESGKAEVDPSIRYYVFLDVETCFELNYPKYAGRGMPDNGDKIGNRTISDKKAAECYNMAGCPYVPKLLDSSLFKREDVMSTLVLITCRGDGLPKKFRARKHKGPSIAVAAVSTPEHKISPNIDQGLPPPAVKPVLLTPEQERDIETCNEEKRPYLLTFSGAGRGEGARRALIDMNNDNDIVTMKRKFITGKEVSYEDLLVGAKFSAAPRGTNLFSYRFTEVLSAGAIPVVHADGWVFPFRKELVDWSKCAVTMPEANASKTEEVLRAITAEQRCEMRKYCYSIYKKYIERAHKVIAGLIDGLELVLPNMTDATDADGVVDAGEGIAATARR